MKKNIKDYLHLYLGCEVMVDVTYPNPYPAQTLRAVLLGIDRLSAMTSYTTRPFDVFGKPWDEYHETKEVPIPILRKLSSMTEEECAYLAWFNMDSEKHLSADARVTKEEMDIHIVRPDGGLMVDEDAAVVVEIACRCFEGQLCVRINGDIEIWSDVGEKLPIERQAEQFYYLVSRGFDLFGLIESGLAIEHKLETI